MQLLKNILFVMLGGAVGAALRYLLSLWCNRLTASVVWLAPFPVATFAINLLGCFLLGILMACGERYAGFTGAPYLMLTVGLCGAFTTFSTFSAETFRLFDNGHALVAVTYITLSVLLGVLLVLLARKIIL